MSTLQLVRYVVQGLIAIEQLPIVIPCFIYLVGVLAELALWLIAQVFLHIFHGSFRLRHVKMCVYPGDASYGVIQ